MPSGACTDGGRVRRTNDEDRLVAELTIGTVEINRIEELRIPNSIFYFTQAQALVAANREWLEPHFLDSQNRFDLVFQSWIFEIGGFVVLIDPCTGNGRPHPVPYFVERRAKLGLTQIPCRFDKFEG